MKRFPIYLNFNLEQIIGFVEIEDLYCLRSDYVLSIGGREKQGTEQAIKEEAIKEEAIKEEAIKFEVLCFGLIPDENYASYLNNKNKEEL